MLSSIDASHSRTAPLDGVIAAARRDARAIARLAAVRSAHVSPIALRDRASQLLEQATLPESIALLFGSLARGDGARDIDLLYIVRHESSRRIYERLEVDAIQVDLNVATSAWLNSAWEDPEWGYCLSESFVLANPPPDLEEQWRTAVSKYWSRGARFRRVQSHLDLAARLIEAADRAERVVRPASAALLAHEAVRIAIMPLIEEFGERVYSHRSFISEILHAGCRAHVDVRDTWAIVRALSAGSRRSVAGYASLYVEVRRAISHALRSIGDYDPGLQREARIHSLIKISERSDAIEDFCSHVWPNALSDLPNLRTAYAVALRTSAAAHQRTESMNEKALLSRSHVVRDPPARGTISGSRWIETSGDRLKVILGTGGCKTPTCVFCVLPVYGRQTARSDDPVKLVDALVTRYRPRRLALYNDGSILNPEELAPDRLMATLNAVADVGVREIDLESVPRFVTNEALSRITRSFAGKVTVAMGFQSIGNWASVALLGRPDPQNVFDRAITLLHRHGISVRLFLLWGCDMFGPTEWEGLLRASLPWARARGIERVTICPYVSHATGTGGATLCTLRAQLARVPIYGMVVDVALAEEPSCGISNLPGCPGCVAALRAGRFQERRHRCRASVPSAT